MGRGRDLLRQRAQWQAARAAAGMAPATGRRGRIGVARAELRRRERRVAQRAKAQNLARQGATNMAGLAGAGGARLGIPMRGGPR